MAKKEKKQSKEKKRQISVDATKLVKEYDEANSELDNRIQNNTYGFDTYDKLFNAYIDPNKWPYSVKLATPRGFTGIFHKTVRMVGGRFTGRIEGVEKGDEMGAKIATEHFKWSIDRFNQHSDVPIEAIVAQWDLNTRLYGAGFVMPRWKVETKKVYNPKTKKKEARIVYNNWWLDLLNNRDVLLQPGRETIKGSDYVIVRRYASLDELERVQLDGASYDESAMRELREMKTGTGRQQNYLSTMRDKKGLDNDDNRFEVCITLYKDKWVTWCPKQGTSSKKEALILRTIENPYVHGEIPVVPLVYIPSQEDVYGMSELQPVRALLKILSALQSQFIELVNKDLYPPTLVNANETRMDTFKFRPKAFWLVNNPTNVTVLDQKTSQSLSSFSETYKMLVTEFLEALGETGQGVSSVDLLGADKTATEVRDRAFLRGARDNFNKIMLSAALKKLMYLIFEMLRDPKFTDKETVIKIVGKDALEYFDKAGLTDWNITDEGYELVYEYAQELLKDPGFAGAARRDEDIFELAYDALTENGELDQYAIPVAEVVTADGVKPKMELTPDGNQGYLYVDPEQDYLGEYNFIPDIEALGMPDNDSEYARRLGWYKEAKESEKDGSLRRDGYQLKHKDILGKLGELVKIKEADQYFEEVSNEAIQTGEGSQGAGSVSPGLPQGGSVPEVPQVPPQPNAGQPLP